MKKAVPASALVFIAAILAVLSVANTDLSGQLPQKTVSGHVPLPAKSLAPIELLAESNQLRLAIGLPIRDQNGLTAFLQQL
jgi:hypothetical protein